MKKALLKDSVKQIKETFKRFCSILVMALLGVGFFVGIKATSPDMLDTLDKYFDDQNVFDIEIMSTLGLTQEDVDALKKVEGVEEVYALYSSDKIINLSDDKGELVVKVLPYSEKNINNVILLEGKLPEKSNECVVEKKFLEKSGKKIGDIVTIEDDEIYINKELTIVGTVQSPLYISRERGTSKLGSGTINYYVYVSEQNINTDIYTQIDIKVADVENLNTFSDEYISKIKQVKDNIEQIKKEREEYRYNSLKNEADSKISEAEEKLEEEKSKGQIELQDAQTKIENAKSQVESSEKELKNSQAKAKIELKNAEEKLKESENTLEEQKIIFNTKKEEAEKHLEEAKTNLSEQEENLQKINTSLEELKRQYELADEDTKVILNTKILELEKTKEQLVLAINTITNSITKGEEELGNGQNSIENATYQIQRGYEELEKNKKDANIKIEEAKPKIENAKKEIEENEKLLLEKKQEFESKITEAEEKIKTEKEKVNDIQSPIWYILDRESNLGYLGFKQDAQSVGNIGKVFPIVFFVVATLISLTSMTRMVEEQRTQIGTLKSLGYNKLQIASKYIIYATLAIVMGSIMGMCIGFRVLPTIIWQMYEMMYDIPDIVINFNTYYAILGLAIISICIIGATSYCCLRELKSCPANLLRPKAPKIGKRVLLEKIPFIWNKLNFSNKVTVRNIFRYKKRCLMTIIGILGCTSLIVVGFGLKDSISNILYNQYETVFNYDMQVNLKNSLEVNEIDAVTKKLEQKKEISECVKSNNQSGEIENNEGKKLDVQIIVPENNESFRKVINLQNEKTGEKYNLDDNEIIITTKAARLLNINVGDKIKLQNSEEKTIEVKVGKITENYIMHYVYMSRQIYQELFNEELKSNVLYINYGEDVQEDVLSKDILSDDRISGRTLTTTLKSSLDDTLSSLNYVVIVLIVSAGLLAFVVLYNLANVNISERIRELATIKVLGFYNNEVYKYITRETILLTILGIMFGLIFGTYLNQFILQTCELDILVFKTIVNPMSYIYSAGLTIIFTIIVNRFVNKTLKKIDMIEALKSVE